MVQLKVIKKMKPNAVERMLQHFEAHKFIQKINGKGIQFGFLTESLKECVRKEWIYSNVIASNFPAFLFSSNTKSNLRTNLEDIRSLVSSTPFSIVEVFQSCFENQEILPESTNAMKIMQSQFQKQNGTVLLNHCFCTSDDAVDIFHKKQRERKNWWRKFSAFPGRFHTNINNRENSKSVVFEVQAEFPWGLETVETVKYLPDFSAENPHVFENLNLSRKKKLPQVVLCEALLEKMTFTYLCDSYEPLNEESEREVLMLDRKLAPFKVAIAGGVSSNDDTKNLEEISLLLAKQIRKLGISVLFLPDACTASVEKQILRNDALGVPYTLLFNDKTLREGFLGIRSRDTTLEESSHVSVVAEYLGKIL